MPIGVIKIYNPTTGKYEEFPAYMGPTGPTGPANGPAGPTGATGSPGKDGKTPYVGSNGNWFVGDDDTGKPSRGEKGADGNPGKNGTDGKDGAPGKDGTDGHTPVITATKANGVTTLKADGTEIATINDGAKGEQGDPGKDGSAGSMGPTGPTGPAGLNQIGATTTTTFANGKLLKAQGGKIVEAVAGTDYIVPPTKVTGTGTVTATLGNGKEYSYAAVTSITLTAGEGESHGFIRFGASTPTVTLSGFSAADGDITSAAASTVWEFSAVDGYIIFKNWSA